jgi:hypothetical protein
MFCLFERRVCERKKKQELHVPTKKKRTQKQRKEKKAKEVTAF